VRIWWLDRADSFDPDTCVTKGQVRTYTLPAPIFLFDFPEGGYDVWSETMELHRCGVWADLIICMLELRRDRESPGAHSSLGKPTLPIPGGTLQSEKRLIEQDPRPRRPPQHAGVRLLLQPGYVSYAE
jgi:hypothetical protein